MQSYFDLLNADPERSTTNTPGTNASEEEFDYSPLHRRSETAPPSQPRALFPPAPGAFIGTPPPYPYPSYPYPPYPYPPAPAASRVAPPPYPYPAPMTDAPPPYPYPPYPYPPYPYPPPPTFTTSAPHGHAGGAALLEVLPPLARRMKAGVRPHHVVQPFPKRGMSGRPQTRRNWYVLIRFSCSLMSVEV